MGVTSGHTQTYRPPCASQHSLIPSSCVSLGPGMKMVQSRGKEPSLSEEFVSVAFVRPNWFKT